MTSTDLAERARMAADIVAESDARLRKHEARTGQQVTRGYDRLSLIRAGRSRHGWTLTEAIEAIDAAVGRGWLQRAVGPNGAPISAYVTG